MSLVRYHTLCRVRIVSIPCPICKKRPKVKNTKEVEKDGKKVRVCKHHVVEM